MSSLKKKKKTNIPQNALLIPFSEVEKIHNRNLIRGEKDDEALHAKHEEE